MDIQRGDQVYYRGEVWTVQGIEQFWDSSDLRYALTRWEYGREILTWARVSQVQRVEQVR